MAVMRHNLYGARRIAAGQCMAQCFVDAPVVGIPRTGAQVQRDDRAGVQRALQPAAQQTMKQMVVPVPKPLFVQAHREQVGVFQPLQIRLPVGRHALRSHDRITQRSAEQVKDRGLEEKFSRSGGMPPAPGSSGSPSHGGSLHATGQPACQHRRPCPISMPPTASQRPSLPSVLPAPPMFRRGGNCNHRAINAAVSPTVKRQSLPADLGELVIRSERLAAPSLERMLLTWNLTAATLTIRRWAIWAFDMPSTSNANTSCSRGEIPTWQRSRCGCRLDQRRQGFGGQGGPPRMGRPDGVGHRRHRDALDQVANGARLKDGPHLIRVGITAQGDHLHGRIQGANGLRRRHAVHLSGQVQVHQHHVRLRCRADVQRLQPMMGFTHKLDVVDGQECKTNATAQ